MTFRQLADHVKQRQRLRHRTMTRPEDDWYPEAFFLRATLHQHPIPTQWFENRASKAALVNRVIVPLIHAGRVRAFSLALVMYMLTSEHPVGQVIAERYEQGAESLTAGLPRFQDVEGSEEKLWVHVMDAERYEAWCAPITRPEQGRPHLGPFELPGGPDAMFGDLVDPIKAALR